MFHVDNAYYLPAVRVQSHRYKTHTVSNTAFRGFGGPQGMIGIERALDRIAFELDRDPLDVRLANLYGNLERNVTPYHQTVEQNPLPVLMRSLATQSNYAARRQSIKSFNASSHAIKRGIALTPVKFGISFTATHLNQAGALVHVYTDGSVMLNHGGIEMGQGLMTKVAQVVAETFQIDLDRVKITATATDKVPNTSATAASSGADLNGMAALDAASQIKDRLTTLAASHFGVGSGAVQFRDNQIIAGRHCIGFSELARLAHLNRVSLSAAGYYRTPKITYDRRTFSGRPFYYFAYGAAVSEVVIDTLTGREPCATSRYPP